MSNRSRTSLSATVRAWMADPSHEGCDPVPARLLLLSPQEPLQIEPIPQQWPELVTLLSATAPDAAAPISRVVDKLSTLIAMPDEQEHFFAKTLPSMLQAVADLDTIITQPLAILQQRSTDSVTVTRRAAHALLCAGLLYQLPLEPAATFQRTMHNKNTEQLKCLLMYMQLVADEPELLNGQFVISRQATPAEKVDPADSDEPMTPVCTVASGLVGCSAGTGGCDCAHSTLSCCCNRQLGGAMTGVLTEEEVAYSVFPESMIAMLLTEELLEYEAIVVRGVRRFCVCQGIAKSFKLIGGTAVMSTDEGSSIALLDAAVYAGVEATQYKIRAMARDVMKAAAAYEPDLLMEPHTPVCTGAWGCGVYGGDLQLKAVLQWIAVSVHSRPLHFHAQSDKNLWVGWLLDAVSRIVRCEQAPIKLIWRWLNEYSKQAPADGVLNYMLQRSLIEFGSVPLGCEPENLTTAQAMLRADFVAAYAKRVFAINEAQLKDVQSDHHHDIADIERLKYDSERAKERAELAAAELDRSSKSAARFAKDAQTQSVALQRAEDKLAQAQNCLEQMKELLVAATDSKSLAAEQTRFAQVELEAASKICIKFQKEQHVQQQHLDCMREKHDQCMTDSARARDNPVGLTTKDIERIRSAQESAELSTEAAEALVAAAMTVTSEAEQFLATCQQAVAQRSNQEAEDEIRRKKALEDVQQAQKECEAAERTAAAGGAKKSLAQQRAAGEQEACEKAGNLKRDMENLQVKKNAEAAQQQIEMKEKLDLAEDQMQRAKSQREKATSGANALSHKLEVATRKQQDEVQTRVDYTALKAAKKNQATAIVRRASKCEQGAAKAQDRELALGNMVEVKEKRESKQAAMADVRDTRQQQADQQRALQRAARKGAQPLFVKIAQLLASPSSSGLDVAALWSIDQLEGVLPQSVLAKPSHAVWSVQGILDLARAVQYCQQNGVWNRPTVFGACADSNWFQPSFAREARHLTRKWRELVECGWSFATKLEQEWKAHYITE